MRYLLLVLLCLSSSLSAESMRSLEPIGGSSGREQASVSALGVSRDDVEDFVGELLDAWNGIGLEQLLADDFPDRNRLLGDLAELPASARLRLLSIGPIQTLESSWEDETLVSLVSVQVRAQLELEGENGLQRHETTQELLIRFVRRLKD